MDDIWSDMNPQTIQSNCGVYLKIVAFLTLVLIVLVLVSCAPSDAAIQKAITQTQTAMPIATIIPLSEIKLEELLFQQGDMPAEYVLGQYKHDIPDVLLQMSSKPVNAVSLDVDREKYGAEVYVYLFDSLDDVNEAYKLLIKNEAINKYDNSVYQSSETTELGEKGTVFEGDINHLFFVQLTKVVFTHCNAVVVANHLGVPGTSLETLITWAKRIDDRLTLAVCR